MNPTLKAGDSLSVAAYAKRKIRVGDVIVFHVPEKQTAYAHRVVSVGHYGVRTRGDKNGSIDSCTTCNENIRGRVVLVNRRGKTIRIHGGWRGSICGRFNRAIRKLDSKISKLLHPAYHTLADSGIFLRCARLLPRTRILAFHRQNGLEFHILMNRHIIGRRSQGSLGWQIKRPFRLFLDKAALPK